MEGRMNLTKAVLEAIPIYWMYLSWIPKGVLETSLDSASSLFGQDRRTTTLFHGKNGTYWPGQKLWGDGS